MISSRIDFGKLDGSGLKIGIVASRWNAEITEALLTQCLRGLKDCNVADADIHILRVPGSFELPYAAKILFEKAGVSAVAVLGCLIKGETMHFEYICEAVSAGIMRLNTDGLPVVFGVLTCLTEDQARARTDHGYGWGMTAVELALLSR